MRRPADPVTLAAFAAAVVIGGFNFVAVRFSNTELAPFWGAALRFAAAALLLFGAMALLRVPPPRVARSSVCCSTACSASSRGTPSRIGRSWRCRRGRRR